MSERIQQIIDAYYPEESVRQRDRRFVVARYIVETAKDELRAELDAGIAARAVAPQGDAAGRPGATCQCREPEAYCGTMPGISQASVICNKCGYKLASEEERAKLPARAPKRDFGTHLCLCDNPGFPPMATDFTRCGTCKGSLWLPDQEPSPGVMCG